MNTMKGCDELNIQCSWHSIVSNDKQLYSTGMLPEISSECRLSQVRYSVWVSSSENICVLPQFYVNVPIQDRIVELIPFNYRRSYMTSSDVSMTFLSMSAYLLPNMLTNCCIYCCAHSVVVLLWPLILSRFAIRTRIIGIGTILNTKAIYKFKIECSISNCTPCAFLYVSFKVRFRPCGMFQLCIV